MNYIVQFQIDCVNTHQWSWMEPGRCAFPGHHGSLFISNAAIGKSILDSVITSVSKIAHFGAKEFLATVRLPEFKKCKDAENWYKSMRYKESEKGEKKNKKTTDEAGVEFTYTGGNMDGCDQRQIDNFKRDFYAAFGRRAKNQLEGSKKWNDELDQRAVYVVCLFAVI